MSGALKNHQKIEGYGGLKVMNKLSTRQTCNDTLKSITPTNPHCKEKNYKRLIKKNILARTVKGRLNIGLKSLVYKESLYLATNLRTLQSFTYSNNP